MWKDVRSEKRATISSSGKGEELRQHFKEGEQGPEVVSSSQSKDETSQKHENKHINKPAAVFKKKEKVEDVEKNITLSNIPTTSTSGSSLDHSRRR